MSNIERGNAFMTASTLDKILSVLNVSASELFTFSKEEKKTDVYKYILKKIESVKNNKEKLDIVKKFLDAIL